MFTKDGWYKSFIFNNIRLRREWLVVNALTTWRTGRCSLMDRPRDVLLLFPVSALFWWYFEYLNRFVQNWSYVGIDAFGPWQYVWYVTLPFSTVLPTCLADSIIFALSSWITCPGQAVRIPGGVPLAYASQRRSRAQTTGRQELVVQRQSKALGLTPVWHAFCSSHDCPVR